MIQRFIYNVLNDGITQINEDPTLIDQLFEDLYALSGEELEAIKTFWKAKPPVLRHGYAPRDIDVPVWSIILENEKESKTWLNNDCGQVEDEDAPDYRADIKGSIWEHRYGVLVMTEHPDVTIYYYEIAKAILLSGNDYFTDQRLFDIDISGSDLTPDARFIPEHLFARRVTFACHRLFSRVDRNSKLGKVTSLQGLHLDRSGSPSDAGSVETNITAYVDGDA